MGGLTFFPSPNADWSSPKMSLTREQLIARQDGIGGSDAGPICGLSPFKGSSALSVYWSKVDPIPLDPESNDDRPWLIWGSLLEPLVRQHYCNVTGRSVMLQKQLIRHPKYHWMVANLDGISCQPHHRIDAGGTFRDGDRGYEGKIYRTSDGWGPDGTTEIPEYVLLQVQHYMIVTGLKVFDVCVLIGNSDFRQYEIKADDDIQQFLFQIEHHFWHTHVLEKSPPEPINEDDARRRWRRVLYQNMPEAEQECIDAWKKLLDVSAKIKLLEKEESALKLVLKKAIGSHEGLVQDGVPIVTWKQTRDTTKVNWDAILREHPELKDTYTVPKTGHRLFLPKKPKSPKKAK